MELSDSDFLLLTYNGNNSYLQTMLKDMTSMGKSFASSSTGSVYQICLTASAIVAINMPSKTIDIYDRVSLQLMRTISTALESLRGIHAIDDNSVVVSDYDTGVVQHFDLSSGNIMWTYTGAKQPSGISSDAGGFIYVAAKETNENHNLSTDGKQYTLI